MPQYEAIWLQKSSETSAQHHLLYSRSSYTLSERRQTKQTECFLSLTSGEEAILYHWKTVVTSSHLTPNELPISETRHSLTSYEGKCFRVFCHTTKKTASLAGNFPFSHRFTKPSNVSPHLFPPQDSTHDPF